MHPEEDYVASEVNDDGRYVDGGLGPGALERSRSIISIRKKVAA